MAKSITNICNDINELMRKNGDSCITFKWIQFYEICDRERIATTIQDKVTKELKKHDLHIIYASHVIVVRDYCSHPVVLEK